MSNAELHRFAAVPETLKVVGRTFDDEKYDERIERLQGSFTEGS